MELLEVQKEADSAGRKAIMFGSFAMLLAALFGYLLAHLGSGGPETQPVVVAAQDIEPLTQFEEKQLKVVDWPIGALPDKTFNNIKDVLASKKLYISGLVTNEPILETRMSTTDRGLKFSQLVEPNMRAYVVQVSEQAASAQLIHPGALCDVIATITDPRNRETVSKVILQNIRVIAVGDSVEIERQDPSAEKPADEHQVNERHRVVTLLVSLGDAEYLAFSSSLGKINLALRSEVDTQAVTTNGVSIERVLGSAHVTDKGPDIKTPPPAPPPPAPTAPQPSRHNANRAKDTSPSIYKVRH